MERQPASAIPPGFEPVVPWHESFDAAYGLEVLDDGRRDGVVRGRVRLRDELRQQFGLLHGGVIAAMAEALASRGTWMGVHDAGKAVMGLSNDTNFLRPITGGHLHQVATVNHRGRTRWLWEVRSSDDDDRLCAITIVNIAVRDRPPRA
jgi:1,4-dihydroxy-2-naphthoyl-CoA hydrolase